MCANLGVRRWDLDCSAVLRNSDGITVVGSAGARPRICEAALIAAPQRFKVLSGPAQSRSSAFFASVTLKTSLGERRSQGLEAPITSLGPENSRSRVLSPRPQAPCSRAGLQSNHFCQSRRLHFTGGKRGLSGHIL